MKKLTILLALIISILINVNAITPSAFQFQLLNSYSSNNIKPTNNADSLYVNTIQKMNKTTGVINTTNDVLVTPTAPTRVGSSSLTKFVSVINSTYSMGSIFNKRTSDNVITYNIGRYDIATSKWKLYYSWNWARDPETNNIVYIDTTLQINSITRGNNDNITWATNNNQLIRINDNGTITIWSMANTNIQSIRAEISSDKSQEILWCGTSTMGIIRFVIDSNDAFTFTLFKTTTLPTILPTNNVKFVEIDKYNVKWFGFGDKEGLVRYDDVNWSRYSYTATTTDKMQSLYIDNAQQMLYLGSPSGIYKFNMGALPIVTISPQNASLTAGATQSVTLSVIPNFASTKIYYTTDGSTPTAASTLYSSPINVTGTNVTKTVKAIAIDESSQTSAVTTGVYTFSSTPQDIPVVSVNPVYATPYNGVSQSVTLTVTPNIAATKIYYTTDGTTPTTSSTLYTGPFNITGYNETKDVIAYAIDEIGQISSSTSGSFVFTQSPTSLIIHVRVTGYNTAPYIYSWTPEYCGGWPGTQISGSADANGYYTYSFPAGVTTANFLFSKGGAPQSADITNVTSETYYTWNGVNNSAPVVDFATALNPLKTTNNLQVEPCPNPFTTEIKFTINETNSHITASITDIQGIEVFSRDLFSADGTIVLPLDLPSGIYILKVTTPTQTYVCRVVKR